MEFVNEPIPLDRVPQLRDDAFVGVDPRHLRVKMVGIAVAAAVVAVGGAILALSAELWLTISMVAGLLVVLAAAAGLAVLEMRRLAYQVRDHDVSLRRGVITHRTETVPFSRVQHVNLTRGPIERLLGLASLEVTSAGPNISIPGLAVSDAERIKQIVVERSDVDETFST